MRWASARFASVPHMAHKLALASAAGFVAANVSNGLGCRATLERDPLPPD